MINDKAILVGVDGSHASYKATWWAANYAKHAGLTLQIVCAYSLPSYAAVSFDATYTAMGDDNAAHNDAQEILSKAKAIADEQGVEATTLIVTGDPASVFVELSRNYNLIVIGNRGKGGLAERLLGTTASQFQGGMEQFIKRFDPLSGEQFRAAVNGTAPIHLTLGYLGPDQLRGWVDIHADHVAATDHQGRRITGVIHDATSRCNQEDKLRQANVVFETAAEGIIIMDGQRQIISVNPAFSSMTQYEEAEIVGKSPEAIMHPRRTPTSIIPGIPCCPAVTPGMAR